MSDDGKVYPPGGEAMPIAEKSTDELKQALAEATAGGSTTASTTKANTKGMTHFFNGQQMTKKEVQASEVKRTEPVLTTRQGRRRAAREAAKKEAGQ